MFQTLGQKVVDLVKAAIVIVLLFIVLISLVHWAKANPDQAQAAFDKVATAAATAIGWTADQITNALD